MSQPRVTVTIPKSLHAYDPFKETYQSHREILQPPIPSQEVVCEALSNTWGLNVFTCAEMLYYLQG